jgi:hypothetical protein
MYDVGRSVAATYSLAKASQMAQLGDYAKGSSSNGQWYGNARPNEQTYLSSSYKIVPRISHKPGHLIRAIVSGQLALEDAVGAATCA